MKEPQFEEIKLKVFDIREEVSREAARETTAYMRQMLATQEEINCVFMAAPFQNELLEHLISEEGIGWSRTNGCHMDEYMGFDIEHPDSFNGFLVKTIFSRAPFKSVHLINRTNDCHEEVERYNRLLDGVQIDITFMGIGENRHIAFNNLAVADFHDTKTVEVMELDEMHRQQQVSDGCFPSFEDVPERALIVTIPKLVSAKKVFYIIPTERKRCAVKAALTGAMTEVYPASILRTAGDIHMYIDKACYRE